MLLAYYSDITLINPKIQDNAISAYVTNANITSQQPLNELKLYRLQIQIANNFVDETVTEDFILTAICHHIFVLNTGAVTNTSTSMISIDNTTFHTAIMPLRAGVGNTMSITIPLPNVKIKKGTVLTLTTTLDVGTILIGSTATFVGIKI